MSFLLLPILLTAAMIVAAMIGCYLVDKKTRLGAWPQRRKQFVMGLAAAIAAMVILQFGFSIHGASDGLQDIVPLCAGLIFGAPVGLVSGFVAALMAAVISPGDFTQFTIVVSLCVAGVFSAFLRHFIFDDKIASPYYGLAAGAVMSVFHMLILLVFHIEDMTQAYMAIAFMAVPLILVSAVTAMLALRLVAVIGQEKSSHSSNSGIAQTFQRWLLVCILAAFAITCTYSWLLQTELAKKDTENILRLNLVDLNADIIEVSDKNLLRIARQTAQQITPDYYKNDGTHSTPYNERLLTLMRTFNLSEIDLIDAKGVIVASTNPNFYGYNMADGAQSAAFLPLLRGKGELVQKYQPISYNKSISRKYAGVSLPVSGFVQVGYDAGQFQKSIADAVNGFTRNKHVGENGGIIICDAKGIIVSDNSGYEGKRLADNGLTITKEILPKISFDASVHGVPSICMYDVAEGYQIITYIPYEEVMLSRNIAVYITSFMEIILFAMIFLLIYFLVKKIVVENIHKINESLAQITSGNLNVRVDVRTNEEFTSLSEDINATVDTLKKYIAEAAARIDKELEFAKTIQLSLLPSVFPPYPDRLEFDLFASMDTAKEVGGDFYDFYLLDKNHLAFLIADVSGKGIPAAMFMMTSKTLIKSLAESGLPVDEVFRQANEKLCENNDANMFVTAWMGVLDLTSGHVEYANAGHNPPLLGSKDGFSYLPSQPDFVLGGMDGMPYECQQLQLQPGDTIMLYTDGLTEAMNEAGQLFGEQRALSVLQRQSQLSAQERVEEMTAAVVEFVGQAEQSDDITMLVLTFKGVSEDVP